MEQEIQQMNAIYHTIVNFFVNYSFQIFGALIIMFLGFLVARKLSDIVVNILLRHDLDATLTNFIGSFVRITIIIMVAIMALNKVGISMTPLLATVGALSLGAGLAIQGLVSNYGAGLNIIITRPFVVGDTIEVQEVKGIVKSVHLGFTRLTDEDNIEITIPNRHIVGEVIKNSQEDRLIDITVRVSYEQGPEQAIEVINAVLKDSSLLSDNRPSQVGISEFGESGIHLNVRIWAATSNYFATRYEINLAIFDALRTADIKIPVHQTDIHVLAE